MRTFLHFVSLGVSIILTAPAYAQAGGTAGAPVPPGSATFELERYLGQYTPGTLRPSDFVGREVHGADDQVIGEIADVLFGPDGRMSEFVLEVGGTLGFGERKVRVPVHAFRIDPGTTATTGTVGGLAPSTEAGVDTRLSNRISPVVYPDRIILPMSAEQLKAMPSFNG
ncbi:PRC-barrel domain-containing protein [Microvirga sp. GCM10011540]|uniref:PRC-barrel domain-containing protein n=1 Tax=Microvirga sp. GCM10011540 TaxID=3317338 RepID=UPI0036200506